MNRIQSISIFLLAILGWTAFLVFGITEGFVLRGITSGETSQAFISAAEQAVEREYVGNMALVLIEDGEIAGRYFHSTDKPVTDSTVFAMASVSKWVTAWGVFSLIERGALDLDTPVDAYLTRWHLPESEFDNQEVTVKRLLSHTAGFVDDLGYAGFEPGVPVQTIEESLTQAADAPWSEGKARVGIEPGSQYMYSGAAYTLLQLVIEEVSGQPFQEFMIDAVLTPLHMDHSTFVWTDSSTGDRATSFDSEGNVVAYSTFTALAAASLNSTVSDLALFLKANTGPNAVLSAESLEAMYTAHAFIGDTGIHALGPTIFARSGDGVFIHGHDGSGGPAINTAARLNLDTGDGIIVLETGHPNIASSIADHWIFWKTGIADFVVITANKNWLLFLLLSGYATIICLTILSGRRRKSRAA
ncbi:MAG: CubicO group peptidase (beta-lactamase class C family) [Rhodothermales bacterium]|jgi:CubicO group peptidase (beta-lactamase class C family)